MRREYRVFANGPGRIRTAIISAHSAQGAMAQAQDCFDMPDSTLWSVEPVASKTRVMVYAHLSHTP